MQLYINMKHIISQYVALFSGDVRSPIFNTGQLQKMLKPKTLEGLVTKVALCQN